MTLRALQQNLVRAVLALCQLSVRSADTDARADFADEALLLLDAASDRSDTELIRLRAAGALQVVDRCAASVRDEAAVARARLWLLRAQSVLVPAPAQSKRAEASPVEKVPKQEPKPRVRTGGGKSQQAVLRWVLENSGMRTREIVAKFDGTLGARTVKRSLSELTAAGLVTRVERGGHQVYEKPPSET